jgi:hypothetical protein
VAHSRIVDPWQACKESCWCVALQAEPHMFSKHSEPLGIVGAEHKLIGAGRELKAV